MKLEDFTLVEKFFKDTGITPNWLHALANGETFIYGDCILNYCYANGIVVINSGSIDDEQFGKSILLHIRSLIKVNERVILSSSVESISDHMAIKYGLIYDKATLTYRRGV